ncbi:MAG TPA: hypothetical protein VI168_06225 [Croceibacterium sp.]
MLMIADADNADYQDSVLDVPMGQGAPRLNNWWRGCEPTEIHFLLRKFWKLVPGTFSHLTPRTTFSRSWTYAHGISAADSQSIMAQMRFTKPGLSEQLSELIGHTVTIYDQLSATNEYTVAAPASGTRVWMLWDLMYQFMLVQKETTNPIPTGVYRGDVDFSNDDHYSGAYLNYRWTNLVVSSGIICPQEYVFE